MTLHFTSCHISCVLSIQTDVILAQLYYTWGVDIEGVLKHPNGDHQKCCQEGSIFWKTCCMQYHVQRVRLVISKNISNNVLKFPYNLI